MHALKPFHDIAKALVSYSTTNIPCMFFNVWNCIRTASLYSSSVLASATKLPFIDIHIIWSLAQRVTWYSHTICALSEERRKKISQCIHAFTLNGLTFQSFCLWLVQECLSSKHTMHQCTTNLNMGSVLPCYAAQMCPGVTQFTGSTIAILFLYFFFFEFSHLKVLVPIHIPNLCLFVCLFFKNMNILKPEVESYLEGFMRESVQLRKNHWKSPFEIRKCGYHL